MPTQSRVPLFTLFGALVVGVVLRFVFLVTHPPVDHHIFEYDTISPIRDQWWFFHFYGAGFGYVLSFVAFGLLTVVLCARRGAIVATIGAVVASVGGILTALGFAAEGVAWAYATDPDVIDPAAGAALLEGFAAHPAMIDDPILTGFLITSIGVLVLLVALWLSRRVPRWMLIATAVILVLELVPPLGLWWEAVKGVAQAVALLAIGSMALRRAKVSE